MNRINLLIACSLATVFAACVKDSFFEGPDFFEDDFESYQQMADLFVADDLRWSFAQETFDMNAIQIDTVRAQSGQVALRFEAQKSEGGNASKASIAKQNMAFWEGETVRLSAAYFIEGTARLNWLFLMDLEEQTPVGAGPGMRLALVDNQLRVEHKFLESDILQISGQELDFPRDQWVNIVWEIKLSQRDEGTVKLWQDGQLIINSANNTTLPQDILYFQQGTKGMYSSCEVGITANSADNALRLWVDDVRFERVD